MADKNFYNYIKLQSDQDHIEYLKKEYNVTNYRDIPKVKYAKDVMVPRDGLTKSLGTFKPYPGGLYDPRIFGYAGKCNCRGMLQKTVYDGVKKTCPNCKCDVMSEDEWMERYSIYEMDVPYVNFLMVPALCKEVKNLFESFNGNNIRDLWSIYLYVESDYFEIPYIDKKGNKQVSKSLKFFDPKTQSDVWIALMDLPPETYEGGKLGKDLRNNPIDVNHMGLFGLLYLSKLFFTYNDPDHNIHVGDRCSKISFLVNKLLPISSPARKNRKKNVIQLAGDTPKVTIGKETISYMALMEYNNHVKKHLENKNLPIVDKATYCWYLNVMINAHFSSNELLQSSRDSLTRRNTDTRIPRGGRALIVAGTDLPMDTVGIPTNFAYDVMQKTIIDTLAQKLADDREAAEAEGLELGPPEIAEDLYKASDPRAIQILHEILEPQINEHGEEYIPAMCKIVRNPSLHKWNMTSFKIKLIGEGTAIQFPIAVDEGYNAEKLGVLCSDI